MAPPSVMFVTLGRPLSHLAQGLFKRCGLLVLERRTFEDFERTLEELWLPDCLVLDLHETSGTDRRVALSTFCALVNKHVRRAGADTHVLVATAVLLEGAEAARSEDMGIHVITTKGPRYRLVARKIMDALGLDGAACCPADSERRVAPRRPQQYRPPSGMKRRD